MNCVCLTASDTHRAGTRRPVTLVILVSADYVKGFGGKFGVQTDRQDKCALGWDHQEKLQLHESQRGTSRLWRWLLRHVMRWAVLSSPFQVVPCLLWSHSPVPVMHHVRAAPRPRASWAILGTADQAA